jgi:hypothetical protein
MPNAHIAMRVDMDVLINQPEVVLQKMSFKILEKREQMLENMIDSKVQFKANNGIEQGTLQSFNTTHCNITVAGQNVKVPFKKLLIF